MGCAILISSIRFLSFLSPVAGRVHSASALSLSGNVVQAGLSLQVVATAFLLRSLSCRRPGSWERRNPAVVIGRGLKCTAERDQRFVAKRTANELHHDRQPRL